MSTNGQHDPAFGPFETTMRAYQRKACRDIEGADKFLPNHGLIKEGAEYRAGAYLLKDLGTSPSEADPDPLRSFREELLSLPWITKRTARHEYFMALEPRTYSYGGEEDCPTCKGDGETNPDRPVPCAVCSETGKVQIKYMSRPFTEHVLHLMDWLNERMCTKFNVCFLNKYDDHFQHLGWHADDFDGMDPQQPIAVVSFGAAREIWVKDKRGYSCGFCEGTGFVHCSQEHPTTPGQTFSCTATNCNNGWVPNGTTPEDQRFLLNEGSLFVMTVGYQDTHLHRIPKHDRPCGWRISLTFRSFLP